MRVCVVHRFVVAAVFVGSLLNSLGNYSGFKRKIESGIGYDYKDGFALSGFDKKVFGKVNMENKFNNIFGGSLELKYSIGFTIKTAKSFVESIDTGVLYGNIFGELWKNLVAFESIKFEYNCSKNIKCSCGYGESIIDPNYDDILLLHGVDWTLDAGLGSYVSRFNFLAGVEYSGLPAYINGQLSPICDVNKINIEKSHVPVRVGGKVVTHALNGVLDFDVFGSVDFVGLGLSVSKGQFFCVNEFRKVSGEREFVRDVTGGFTVSNQTLVAVSCVWPWVIGCNFKLMLAKYVRVIDKISIGVRCGNCDYKDKLCGALKKNNLYVASGGSTYVKLEGNLGVKDVYYLGVKNWGWKISMERGWHLPSSGFGIYIITEARMYSDASRIDNQYGCYGKFGEDSGMNHYFDVGGSISGNVKALDDLKMTVGGGMSIIYAAAGERYYPVLWNVYIKCEKDLDSSDKVVFKKYGK